MYFECMLYVHYGVQQFEYRALSLHYISLWKMHNKHGFLEKLKHTVQYFKSLKDTILLFPRDVGIFAYHCK